MGRSFVSLPLSLSHSASPKTGTGPGLPGQTSAGLLGQLGSPQGSYPEVCDLHLRGQRWALEIVNCGRSVF